jgi:pyruvate-ferredoxin/flavodoxin oxidoreductase
MGKRTNTILQSAFFALANIMPIAEAVDYMKYAAKKSYLKKGEDVVALNYKAIDAGVEALHEVKIPAAWATAKDDTVAAKATGKREDLVFLIKERHGDSPCGVLDTMLL